MSQVFFRIRILISGIYSEIGAVRLFSRNESSIKEKLQLRSMPNRDLLQTIARSGSQNFRGIPDDAAG
jgi:hypothetical protein